MAERPAWKLTNYVKRELFSFDWNGGFAVSQKKKNINNLHSAIRRKYNEPVLEISTKSDVELGQKLSAFHLKINDYYLENIFQSSKVYENGGPYLDLLTVQPTDAKKDPRHKTSGKLTGFFYHDELWELEPKTAFYDYLYISAAKEMLKQEELEALCEYEWFTDIEFNPNKSINCQARAVALLKYVIKNDCWNVLENKATWLEFHRKLVRG